MSLTRTKLATLPWFLISAIPHSRRCVCVVCDHVINEKIMAQRDELLVFQWLGARLRIMHI